MSRAVNVRIGNSGDVDKATKDALRDMRREYTGTADYEEVMGQTFTPMECREAADFSDVVVSYSVNEEILVSFISEDMKVGQRLYMALNLPESALGAMALNEKDPRIIHIIKQRSVVTAMEEDGRSNIILPGE